MSTHVWCHGPSCHTYVTTDRVRGSKGSKVLRTRKVKQWGTASLYNWFCSLHCYNEFANTYIQQIIKIAPRLEPLETPIHDPKKTEHSHEYSSGHVHKWTTTEIKKIDTESNIG